MYDLADSVGAAKAVHEKGGGAASFDHLAAFLGYKSANNGAFINRVAAAKLFGLLDGPRTRIVITQRAQTVLMPVTAADHKQALVDAFLDVPLYKAIYKEYHGKDLPPEFGLKNAFRTMFGVTPQRTDPAYRAFMNSAETAGFFEVKGSKTQLLMPMVQAGTPKPPAPNEEDSAGSGDPDGRHGGNGGGSGTPPRTMTAEDLKNEYISTLIGVLRDKGSKGEVDDALMERIEKLLKLPE
jgi:hypothetical protein